jgi:hypothetical protein
MKDFIEIIADHLSAERLNQMSRAVETLRDCAKEAMSNARAAGNDVASKICQTAYQGSTRQLSVLKRVIMTKEGD